MHTTLINSQIPDFKVQAYAEYLASLKQYPNRFRALYGAARAADAAGDSANAALYYRRLVELSAHADTARPEVQQARAYVERKRD